MSKKYLDAETVILELKNYFVNQYNHEKPLVEKIHEVENIIQNIEPVKLAKAKTVCVSGVIVDVPSDCPECGAGLINYTK